MMQDQASLKKERVLILGSTGSIGLSTLDVLNRHTDRFDVVGLSAHSNIDRLLEQAQQYTPHYLCISDASAYNRWQSLGYTNTLLRTYQQLGLNQPEILHLPEDLLQLCRSNEIDTVVAAIVGAAGLNPTLSAVRAGKKVLLANKEALVLGGHVMMDAAQTSGAVILPVDSEHNAIFQSLPDGFVRHNAHDLGIRSLILTASGGPFRTRDLSTFDSITPEQAVAHPNWSMGRKISVDSATMANKGLEVIEAFWLFGLPVEQIQVVIHPQSIVHSMVQYIDGSVVAQMGLPDMRTPIAHVLGFPNRIESGVASLNLTQLSGLTFMEPDYERFPALRLAFDALNNGDSHTAVFNAANEVAVQAFLDGHIAFTKIAQAIDYTMERIAPETVNHLDVALMADQQARTIAHQFCISAAS